MSTGDTFYETVKSAIRDYAEIKVKTVNGGVAHPMSLHAAPLAYELSQQNIIDRLAAAPAQVTREEIESVCRAARVSWFFSNNFDKESRDKFELDAIMSLLAERGLVKEG